VYNKLKMKTFLFVLLVVVLIKPCAVIASPKKARWATECSSHESSMFKKMEIEWEASEFKVTGHFFLDPQCKQPDWTVRFRYSVKPAKEAALSPNTQYLDLRLTKVDYTPLSQTEVSDANHKKYCGISNWKKGASRSVSGLKCGKVVWGTTGSKHLAVVEKAGNKLYMDQVPEDKPRPKVGNHSETFTLIPK
jgi:hypothetical protein